MIERTFSILKPDAVSRNLTGKINAMLEEDGFKIIAQKMIHMSKEKAEGFYIVHKDIDVKDIKLQEEEVQDIKWFDRDDVVKRINNNYEDLTDKTGCWNYLQKYFEMKNKDAKNKD